MHQMTNVFFPLEKKTSSEIAETLLNISTIQLQRKSLQLLQAEITAVQCTLLKYSIKLS